MEYFEAQVCSAAMLFEFTDAEVAACHVEGSMCAARFAAALVMDDSEAQWMALRLVGELARPVAEQDLKTCMGRLHAGLVQQGGLRLRQLPLPWQASESVLLELEFAHGELLQLHFKQLMLERVPDSCAVGAFQC